MKQLIYMIESRYCLPQQLQTIALLFILALMVFPFAGMAQYEKEWFRELSEEDYKQMEALAMYPKEIRLDILEVAQYPQAIIALKRIQEQSSIAFQQLLENNTGAEQKAIWDLTRYPGLIDDLANSDFKTRKAVLQNYPTVIFDRANETARAFPDLLRAIQQLQKSTDNTIVGIISSYPEQTATALYRLIDLPEVLSVLGDNIELSIMVGELYKKDPDWVIQKSDSVNLAQARLQTQELKDWETNINDNSEVATEMKASAQQYAEAYGYDDVYYNGYPEDETEEVYVVERHYYHHYPYWFGYPSWYTYPRWRPLPWWYDWGFYSYPGRGVMVIGIPSHFCINWYFSLGQHHYYYPHFSAYLVNHYHRYPRSTAGISRGVENWRQTNKRIVTDQWFEKKEGRVERFRELGRLEKDRVAYNSKHLDQRLSKEAYLDKHLKKYPSLEKNRQEINRKQEPQKAIGRKQAPVIDRPATKPKIQPENKPNINIEERSKVAPESKSNRPKKVTAPKRETPKANIPSINKGKDYHQDKWEQIQQDRKTPRTAPSKNTRKTPVKIKTKKPSKRGN